MDKKTRGLIEEALDNSFQKQNFLETAEWVLEADDDVTSQEDLVLGYFLGAFMMWTHEVLEKEKIFKEYDERMERLKKKQEKRLEREFGKEKAMELMIKQDYMEKRAKKDLPPYRIEITHEEKEDVRDILRLRIKSFREKIRTERALRGLGA